MSETDAEFLKRFRDDYRWIWAGDDMEDLDRLLALARRGAKVPDEPSEAMNKAAHDAWRGDKRNWHEIYHVMLTAALKDTDNESS